MRKKDFKKKTKRVGSDAATQRDAFTPDVHAAMLKY